MARDDGGTARVGRQAVSGSLTAPGNRNGQDLIQVKRPGPCLLYFFFVRCFAIRPSAHWPEVSPRGDSARRWDGGRRLAAMVARFRPRIEKLIAQRDVQLASWREHASEDAFENRSLNRISSATVDIVQQLVAIERKLDLAGAV